MTFSQTCTHVRTAREKILFAKRHIEVRRECCFNWHMPTRNLMRRGQRALLPNKRCGLSLKGSGRILFLESNLIPCICGQMDLTRFCRINSQSRCRKRRSAKGVPSLFFICWSPFFSDGLSHCGHFLLTLWSLFAELQLRQGDKHLSKYTFYSELIVDVEQIIPFSGFSFFLSPFRFPLFSVPVFFFLFLSSSLLT